MVAPDAVDDLAAQLAAYHLDAEYAGLLSVTPLEERDAMVGLFLEDAC